MARPNIAQAILRAQGRPAEYTAPGGFAVPCRVKIREADARVRLNKTAEMAAAQVLGCVSADLGVTNGGIIEQGDSRYLIEDWQPSSVPGLVDLILTRIEGRAQVIHDMSRAALAGYRAEPVPFLIDGEWVEIRGHVRRQVVQPDEMGEFTEILQVIAIAEADAAHLDEGTMARLDGVERPIASLMRDEGGIVKVVI
ncbi:hypothetical protein [Paracoccus beibuensis]|uniref:hypothetical protein n=1 Tax=Paracoccus beibuensis TaxID=547602 RepID=UPI00223F9B79|nr:hypothetical protein [Paracoccus beibuensis]